MALQKETNPPPPPTAALQDALLAKSWLLVRRTRQVFRLALHPRLLISQRADLRTHFDQNRGTREACWVFAPGLSWARQLFQRPQQLALALGQLGQLVYYLEPEPLPRQPTLTQVGQGVWLVNAPPEALDFLPSPLLYLLPWSDSPARCFASPRLVYDIVDDFSAFRVNQRLLRYQHSQRIHQAKCVLVTAHRLLEQFQPQRSDALLCPNGVDYSHFHTHGQAAPPDLADLLAAGKPILGYYGALAEWLDYPLLSSLAALRSDLSFLLIGPSHDLSLESSGLLQISNIHWIGPRPYAHLPSYLQAFDTALIPFRITPVTNATSPIKLFEYLAGGKPVVSTPITECQNLPGVFTAATAVDFSAQIDRALACKNDPAYLNLIDQTALQNTWDARARQILESLQLPISLIP